MIECMTDEEVAGSWKSPICFPSFPLHTQSVESAVVLVSEASHQVEGEERRHESILSVIKARKMRRPFDTKKNYSNAFS